jgi:hypothetical protein
VEHKFRFQSKDYRAHLAAHKRAMGAPQHDYDVTRPHVPHLTNARGQTSYADLIRYAAAIGRKRGDLPHDLKDFIATGWRDEAQGYVDFQQCKPARYRSDESYTPKKGVAPIRVYVANLDWQPAPYTETLEYKDRPHDQTITA